MSAERLRQILHNVADETRPVPLEAAAMAQSRQMTVRRTVAGAAAAVVLLVAGVFGATAVWSDRGAPPVDPAVSDSPTVPTENSHMEGQVTYYVGGDDGLYSLVGNGVLKPVLTGEPYLGATANVSRDGRYVSWVSADFKVKLLDTTTGDQRVLMDYADDFCQEPVWSGDSYELFVKQGEDFGFYDITTDEFTELGFNLDGCHVQLDERPGSGDPAIEREYFYVDRDANKLVRFDDQGDKISETGTIYGQGREIIGVQSHTDGEYYCLVTAGEDEPLGDFVRSPDCAVLAEPNGDGGWDVVTTGSDDPRSILPAWDEGWLVRESDGGAGMRFTKYDENGEILWTEPEYAGLAEYRLLAWRLQDL